jgi:hypothetical protein
MCKDPTYSQKLIDISYEMFLPNFLAANFVMDEKDPKFGHTQNLNDGPLKNMELEYYPISPNRKGMEGVVGFIWYLIYLVFVCFLIS